MMMTTVWGDALRALSRRPMPSIPGSLRSVRMTAGGASRRIAAAASAVAAHSTSNPSRPRMAFRMSSCFLSSSTTRTRRGSITWHSPLASGGIPRRRRRSSHREVDPERRPLVEGAVHLDLTAVFLHHLLRNREPQPDTGFTRREIRLEDPLEIGRRYPAARVAKDDGNRWPRAVLRGPCLDREGPSRWSGLKGIDHDIEEAGPEPLRIGLDDGEVRGDVPQDLDPLIARLGHDERQHLVKGLLDPAGARRQPRRPPVAQEVADHTVQARQLVPDRGDDCGVLLRSLRIRRLEFRPQVIDAQTDQIQRIADLVRHGGRQLCDGRSALGAPQTRFEGALLPELLDHGVEGRHQPPDLVLPP